MARDVRRASLAALGLACAACGGNPLPLFDDAAPDDAAPPDAARHGTALAHTVYLSTGAATILVGPDDATADVAAAPAPPGPYAVLGYAGGVDVVSEVNAILGVFDVTATLDRPPRPDTEPYQMIVLTDTSPRDLGFGAVASAIAPVGCAPAAFEVGFVFTRGRSTHDIAQRAIAVLGAMSQIPLSATPGDCMCLLDAGCPATLAARCTIGGAGVLLDATHSPCIGTHDPVTFDESAAWHAAFGDR